VTTAAIRVERLGKRYELTAPLHGRARYRTLRESVSEGVGALTRRLRGQRAPTPHEFWALKDVSLEVEPGQVLGIIGRNGAGKSTLLKILSRITRPTQGRAVINGRVGSLLEVGTGFHPELTGRENVYLNGSILGMSRREIDRKFARIVEFAEVEQFLDTPVKRYSSGMYVRLAFAVAAHLDPEILIVDEVLAVGDLAFQRKCVQRMGEVSRDGRTVLIVSHDIPMISRLSTRVVWLRDGCVYRDGSPADVIDGYYAFASRSAGPTADVDLRNHPNYRSNGISVQRSLRILSSDGGPATAIPAGDAVTFEVGFDPKVVAFDYVLGIDLCDPAGTPLAQLSTSSHPGPPLCDIADGRLACTIDELPLVPGEYMVNVWVGDADDWVDAVVDAARLTVLPADYFGTGRLPPRRCGPLLIRGSWSSAPGGCE
jgi:lipopolysaccharide transport system ATP-binding protein